MKPVDQTTFGMPEGNCFAACVASVLEVPLDSVPNFCAEKNWFERFAHWLRPKNLLPVMFLTNDAQAFVGDAFVLVGGDAARGHKHSVVYCGGVMVHDPHPDRAGLITIEDVMLFVAIDPAHVVSLAQIASRYADDCYPVAFRREINETTEETVIDYTRESDWRHYLSTPCPVCGEQQFSCRNGTSCDNGHGF